MIKFIYFDLGGVVIDNNKRVASLAQEFGLNIQELSDFFDRFWRPACRGELDNIAYLKLFKERFGVRDPQEDFVKFVGSHQGHYQETHDIIHELFGTYKLGILSNAELGFIDFHLANGKIPNIAWSAVIESAQHSTVKPEAKIFELAERMAGVPAEEIFFIDDVPDYIEAAKKRGWQGMVFDTKSPKKSILQIKHYLQGESS